MASLSDLVLTLEQTQIQRKLKTVTIIYQYTLNCSGAECDEEKPWQVSVDILGDDVVVDDKLAVDADAHGVVCRRQPGGLRMVRKFVVGQSLLDEDLGDDEIKLTIRVRDEQNQEICSATTGIVRGNF